MKTPEERAEYQRTYAADPVNKARKIVADRAWRATPEVTARLLAYRANPEIKARDAEVARKRRETPEDKKKQAEYAHRPERVLRSRELAKKRREENPGKIAAKARQWRRGLKDKLNLLKAARPCYDCGGTFPPECLDWDHLPGTEKRFTIGSQAQNHTFDAVIDEIAKCQLVCACCHRTRTLNRGKKGAA